MNIFRLLLSKMFKVNLYLFPVLYCLSLIAGELSIILLVTVNRLCLSFPRMDIISLLLAESATAMTLVSITSLFLIIPWFFFAILAVKTKFNWNKSRSRVFSLLLPFFFLMFTLWYSFFWFIGQFKSEVQHLLLV
jgi:hypothetical protein